ncbi:unnamed protein product [Moneuplotes crassus]|uniref:Uncharacterized protein n=1 Tax=Euplotes crassus TaxID=5936 RepID=A0AAD1U1G5_EUPCR|nr:unnamed protein product [Moneuplotes crassus]
MNKTAFSIFVNYLEKPEFPHSISLEISKQCLMIGDYFNSPQFLYDLIEQNIKPNMNSKTVLTFLVDSMSNMNKNKDTYGSWLGLFNFCLKYMAENLDKLCNEKSTNQQLMNLCDSNPLILEAVIEKGMKSCVEANYSKKDDLKDACLSILKKLRNPPTSSLSYLINLEQKRKLLNISKKSDRIAPNQFIKWRISDPMVPFKSTSPPVQIHSYNFIFFAERNEEFSGLKIFTMLMPTKNKGLFNITSNRSNAAHEGNLRYQRLKNQGSQEDSSLSFEDEKQILVCHCMVLNNTEQPNTTTQSEEDNQFAFHCCEAGKKVEIARFDCIQTPGHEHVIQIYQKIDYIQSLIQRELKIQKESPLFNKNLTNLVKLGICRNKETTKSKSQDYGKPNLSRFKNLNLSKAFNQKPKDLFPRDLQEPELYVQSLYKSGRRSQKSCTSYFTRQSSSKPKRRSYSSFTNNLGHDSKTRIKKMSLMLNPYSVGKKIPQEEFQNKNERILIQTNQSPKLDKHIVSKNYREAAKYRLLNCQSVASSKSSLFDEHMRNPPYEYESFASSDKENISANDKICMLELLLKEKNKEIKNLKRQINPRRERYSETRTNCDDNRETLSRSRKQIQREKLRREVSSKLDNYSMNEDNPKRFFAYMRNPKSMQDSNSRCSFR